MNSPGSLRARRAGRVASLAALALTLLATGCAPPSLLITPVADARSLREFELSRESIWAGDKLALVEVEGAISSTPVQSWFGLPADSPLAHFRAQLDKAAGDPQVKALLLRINSPGGGVTASDIMHQELRRFRQNSGKPIIAALMDVAASGGYYIACAADRIIAQPTTVTGSIGVIMMMPDLSGTMSLIGAKANVIKSGPLKDAGSPFRSLEPADRAVFQKIVDQMYARFLEVVRNGRPGVDAARLPQLADGRVMLASDALEAGLIDEIGTLPDAVRAAKSAAGIADRSVVVVQYARGPGYRPNIYAEGPVAAAPPTSVSMINLEAPEWLRGDGPRFMYLWAPGW